MAFMDAAHVVGDAPNRLLFQVDVVSVKNLPTELAKEVSVKVYMSQKVNLSGATTWQELGTTKAWCPKRWKPQKQNQANPLRQSTASTQSISSQILATASVETRS